MYSLSSMRHVDAFARKGVQSLSSHAQAAEKALNFVFFSVSKAQFLQWLPNVRGYEDVFEGPCLDHPEQNVCVVVLFYKLHKKGCRDRPKPATCPHIRSHKCRQACLYACLQHCGENQGTFAPSKTFKAHRRSNVSCPACAERERAMGPPARSTRPAQLHTMTVIGKVRSADVAFGYTTYCSHKVFVSIP